MLVTPSPNVIQGGLGSALAFAANGSVQWTPPSTHQSWKFGNLVPGNGDQAVVHIDHNFTTLGEEKVGLWMLAAATPGSADANRLIGLDLTVVANSANHTGELFGYTMALSFKAGSATHGKGVCYTCWPFYEVLTGQTVTELIGYRVYHTTGTKDGTVTDYYDFMSEANSFAVAGNWRGLKIGNRSGNVATTAATFTAVGIEVGTIASNAGTGGGSKAGLQIGAITGTGANNFGIYVGSVSGADNNYGIYVSSGPTYGAYFAGGGVVVAGGGLAVVGALSANYTVTDVTTVGAATYTAAQLLGGIIERDCNGASRTDTTDTAANILAANTRLALTGDSFECLLKNVSNAAETITIAGGVGVSVWTTTGTGSWVSGGTAQKTIAQYGEARLRFTRTSGSTLDLYIL